MSFTGVSFVGDGTSTSRSASAISATTASGYHLLVVDGYSRTKAIPNGDCVESRPFRVGGHRWIIEYYPNGKDAEDADSVSLFLLLLDDNVLDTVMVHFDFSFIDEVEKQASAAIRATEAYSFVSDSSWGYRRFITRKALERSGHLKDDGFTIRCDVVVDLSAKDATAASEEEQLVVVMPPSDMHRHFGDLLRSKHGADVVFEVCGETFTAHRCVLAARSTVFKAQLFGSTKDGVASSIIRIDDMEAEVFKDLLTFIYTDTLPGIEKGGVGAQDEDDDEMAEVDAERQQEEKPGDDGGHQAEQGNKVMWQNLLVSADRYDLQRLKLICEQKLRSFMDQSSVTTFLVIAEQHHCQILKEACLNFLRSPVNMQMVMDADGFEHVTRTCPSVLKELLAKFASHV
ncbi:hypothetical protein ACP4OV_015784 [Aristida adscensionis]